ncbi:methyltransferase family protein [Candidatus Uabimicrobium amorphum]|uniref:Farnesyl cysteine carboxyl-methyltransferase n=1 Tax=Uabimicrobium amorphum TaxID=2596890 RepID=A0A5S9ITD5_UABAM|nr:isoprenylcysteine carboxylmethyltransferase family protein [Candidatus Uabimicrobium amorphum]BBM87071.1 farnesyl cysteine carboxyl-methyltransferase [Candidatus Uabimicrobium amorphum]
MKTYDRIFGAGPRGFFISLVALAVAWKLEPLVSLPIVCSDVLIRWSMFFIALIATLLLVIWSFWSLPPATRGKELVTTGAFRYFRHPLYAAFLLFFNFGLAILLNNWIYIFWAVALHGIWHLNIIKEEKLMKQEFPKEYTEYCTKTGRFVPRLW